MGVCYNRFYYAFLKFPTVRDVLQTFDESMERDRQRGSDAFVAYLSLPNIVTLDSEFKHLGSLQIIRKTGHYSREFWQAF